MSYRPHHQSRTLPTMASSAARVPVAAVLDRLFPRQSAARPVDQRAGQRLLAPQSRALTLRPASWNAESRTIDVVWTTGSRGVRFDFDTMGLVDEELATEPKNVRLARLNLGAPVLNTHQRADLRAQIGTVVPGSARMERGQGIATLQLSDRDDVAPIVADIAAGIIRNLSVGYTVHAFDVDRRASPRPLYRAVDWEPTEISFVPVPFDAGAQVRDLAAVAPTTCIIRNMPSREKKPMNWITNFVRSRQAPAAPPLDLTRTRLPIGNEPNPELSYDGPAALGWMREYTQMAASHYGLPADIVAELTLEMVDRQLSEGEVRDAMVAVVSERQRQQTNSVRPTPSNVPGLNDSRAVRSLIHSGGTQTLDNPVFRSRAIEDALFARMSGTAPNEAAREFMSMTMVQIAGDMLARAGARDVHRMSAERILNAAAWNSGGTTRAWSDDGYSRDGGGMHTTSDFPELLLGAGQRYLMAMFEIAASPLKQISRQRSSRDFRNLTGIQLSSFGTLLPMTEAGEFKHGTFTERKETYRVRTYGKQFALSREAIVNDDLQAFADPMVVMARASAETEAQLLAELLNSNPAMSDGKALFHADHGNLAAPGTRPSVAAIDAGRRAMRRQMDADGKTPLSISPKYIVSGIDEETNIEQVLTTVQPSTTSEANPFAGKLTPLVDPRLDPKAWYLAGGPQSAPALEHAYLNDKTGPVVEQREGWNVLGQEFRVYMDFGAGVVDHRGIYKNTGAAG